MSIQARVVEVLHDGDIRGRGESEFLYLPSPGDRVVLTGPRGDLDIMRVLYVEHSPVQIPRAKAYEDTEPTVTIYVEFAERYTGEQ